jgi:integrase
MKKLSKTSVSNYLREVRGFLRWIYKRRRVSIDHAAALDGPRIRESELVHPRRALTDAELCRLLEAARERPGIEVTTVRRGQRRGSRDAEVSEAALRKAELLGQERATVYLLACWTGLRRQELAALTWDMLHPNPNRLQLPATVTKNGDRATILLHSEAVAVLDDWRCALQAQSGAGAPMPKSKMFRTIPAMRVLRRDLELAGIDYLVDGQGFADFHALRNTFNMRLKSAGLDTVVRQQFMRHSDPKLTDCTYMDPSKLPLASELAKLPAIRADGGQLN